VFLSHTLSSLYSGHLEFFKEVPVRWDDVLAVVEDDGAVRPAVVVDQAQVGEEAHADRLETPLVAQGESVAVDLQGEQCR